MLPGDQRTTAKPLTVLASSLFKRCAMESTKVETEKVQSTFGHLETAVHSMTATWMVMLVLCGQSGTGFHDLMCVTRLRDANVQYVELDIKH